MSQAISFTLLILCPIGQQKNFLHIVYIVVEKKQKVRKMTSICLAQCEVELSRKKLSGWNFGPGDQNSMENWSPGQFFYGTSLENWSASGKMVRSIKYCSLLAVMTVQVVE